MKPIHKYNGGLGATICNKCRAIITTGLTEDLLCDNCIEDPDYADWIHLEHRYYYGIRTGKIDRDQTVFQWMRSSYYFPKLKNKENDN